MADVSISVREASPELHKINGDVNGSCDEDHDEPMDVDPLEAESPKSKTISDSNDLKAKENDEDEDDDGKSLNDDDNSVDTNPIKSTSDDKEVSQSSIPEEEDDDDDVDEEDMDEDAATPINDGASKAESDVELAASTPSSTTATATNKNSTPKIVPPIQDDEIHNIPDSDEEEEENSINNKSSQEQKSPASKFVAPEIEKMDVDGGDANGHINDDDKPVSIHSDSESEADSAADTTKNDSTMNSSKLKESKTQNGDCTSPEVHEILSDKEDCIVLDEKEEDTPRKRQRKSGAHSRSYTNVDDDDIEEITSDDPLQMDNTNKKSLKTPQLVAPPLAPFSNQISIKDARSLAVPAGTIISKATGPNAFQQQFLQQHQQSNSKKEPTLVIIDTNSILSGRGGQPATPQSLLNKSPSGFSVHPVGVPAQGLYPPNMRTSITPIMSKTMPGLTQASTNISPASIPQLLPALTDDMFVLEAPSFIVPYIYEKPPSENLKEIVTKIGVDLEQKRKNEQLEKAEKDKPKSEATDNKESKETDSDVKDDTDDNNDSKSKSKKKQKKSGDDSWDELDTSTDDEASDTEQRTKVLIKEVDNDVIDDIKKHIIHAPASETVSDSSSTTPVVSDSVKKTENYFESPLGKFFMNIGINLVQEHVQTDLLRQQKRKCTREGPNPSPQIQMAINSLMKNLEFSRETNEPFKFETKRCEYCNFKSESSLSMANHYETPHMRNYVYKCNFCTFETRPPHDILFHMEAVHNIKGRLEKGPHYHQCPNCPWEDNGKSKLARHAVVCAKKFRPEVNLSAPPDWEPPAKIPRIKPKHGLVGTANAYQAMAAQQQRVAASLAQRQIPAQTPGLIRARNKASMMPKAPMPNSIPMRPGQNPVRNQIAGMPMPNNYSLSAASSSTGQFLQSPSGNQKSKASHQQPSISITPLPRQQQQSASGLPPAGQKPGSMAIKPGQNPNGNGKSAFVICEICDGYIRDLDQLRNHMQWIHKIKIHPKMIYNRPPLNCQKCQYRFFTDQGLERHLLGSHGLVTSSMQEAANKAKDAGRCPVCGKVFQWKLLNHVSRDHNMTLKPAHLSYKCTVCTATFGMYKQFENHVYSAHSSVAKKSMENRKSTPSSSNSNNSSKIGGDSLLKPLKINDEITIIPQPASKSGKPIEIESHVID